MRFGWLGSILFTAFAGIVLCINSAAAQTFSPSGPGSVSGTFPSLTINGAPSGTTKVSGTFSSNGTLTFHWAYRDDDAPPVYDPAGYINNGASVQLTIDYGAEDQSGDVTVPVVAGQTYGWYQQDDSCCGVGHLTISATFTTDFSSSSAQAQALSFVGERQQLLLETLDFPTIFDRGTTGIQIQQDATGLLNGLAFSASTKGVTSPAQVALDRATLDRAEADLAKEADQGDKSGLNFWIDGSFGLHATDGSLGRFAVTTVGVDKLVTDRILLGFAVEGDWVTAPASMSGISGIGVMAGPYASVDLGDHLAFSAHLLTGRSWNDQTVASSGTQYAGAFETSRIDAGAALSGDYAVDLLTIHPEASFSLISEGADAYSVSGGGTTNTIPGFNVSTFELTAGSSFEYRLATGTGAVLTPTAGLKLGIDAGTTSSEFAEALLGIGVQTDAGLALNVDLRSRLGAGGLQTVAASANASAHF